MPSADGEHFGRHQMYKTGTIGVITWIGKTASRCCNTQSIINSLLRQLDHEVADWINTIEPHNKNGKANEVAKSLDFPTGLAEYVENATPLACVRLSNVLRRISDHRL